MATSTEASTPFKVAYIVDMVDSLKDLPNDFRRIQDLMGKLDRQTLIYQGEIEKQYLEILELANSTEGWSSLLVDKLEKLRHRQQIVMLLHAEKLSLRKQATLYINSFEQRIETSLNDFANDLGENVPPEDYLKNEEAKRMVRKPDKKRRQLMRRDRDKYRKINPLRPANAGEEVYCLCEQTQDARMIACDSGTCPIEWFHIDCLQLSEEVVNSEEPWLCEHCKRIIDYIAESKTNDEPNTTES